MRLNYFGDFNWFGLTYSKTMDETSRNYLLKLAARAPCGSPIIHGIAETIRNPVVGIITVAEAAFKGLAHLFGWVICPQRFTPLFTISFAIDGAKAGFQALVQSVAFPVMFAMHALNYSTLTKCMMEDLDDRFDKPIHIDN